MAALKIQVKHQKDHLEGCVDTTLQLLQGLGLNPSKVLKKYLKGRKRSSLTRNELSGLNGWLAEQYSEAYSYWVMMRIEQDQKLVPDTNEGIKPIKSKFFRFNNTSFKINVFENKVSVKIRKDDFIKKDSEFAEMDYEVGMGMKYYFTKIKELYGKLS